RSIRGCRARAPTSTSRPDARASSSSSISTTCATPRSGSRGACPARSRRDRVNPRMQSKSAYVDLEAGRARELELEYFDNVRDAEVRLAWRLPSAKPPRSGQSADAEQERLRRPRGRTRARARARVFRQRARRRGPARVAPAQREAAVRGGARRGPGRVERLLER